MQQTTPELTFRIAWTSRAVLIAALLAVLSFLSSPVAGQQPAATADWVQTSNAQAQPVLEVLAKYNPESAGRFGLDQYDEGILDMLPQVYERHQGDFRRV